MSIIDDGCDTFARANRLEATVDRLQRAESYEDLLLTLAHTACCAIDSQEIGNIEPTYELHAHFTSADVECHSFEAFFYDTGMEIS